MVALKKYCSAQTHTHTHTHTRSANRQSGGGQLPATMAAPGGATALRRSTWGRSGPSPAKDDELQKIRLAAFELVMDVHLPPTHRYSTAVKEFYCSAHGLDFEQVRTNMNY